MSDQVHIHREGMVAVESIDISGRADVDKLKPNAVGLAGVLFAALSAAAPLTAMLGNVPYAVGFGNGIGAPSGFAFATIVLTIFSVGYVAMARKLTTAGGFYSFISHGLGRVLGVASGWIGASAYCVFEASLLGILAFFAHATVNEKLGWDIPWPWYAFGALILINIITYFDIELSVRVLGVLMVTEVVILLIMDFGILFQGGNPDTGLNMEAVNGISAFQTNGHPPGTGSVGIGLFFAFWSWVGFEACPNYAEESRDPVRIVPRATYISVVALGVFYVFTSWMIVSAWGPDEQVVEAAASAPLDFFFVQNTEFVGVFFTDLMKWLIITGSFACALSLGHNASIRYWYSMGREGLIPKVFGRTHPRYRSPYMASYLQSALTAILVTLFAVGSATDGYTSDEWALNGGFFGMYAQLATIGTMWILMLQTLVSVAIVVYFSRHHRDEHNIWKTQIAPAIAAIAQAIVIFLLLNNLEVTTGISGLTPYIPWLGWAWFAVGIGIALVIRAVRPELYTQLGRFVNRGLSADEDTPVSTR